MTRTSKLLLIAAFVLGAAFAAPTPAHAQPPGYGGRINCSSNNGRRNCCDIGRARDAQLIRQISGSPCIRDHTWGIDDRGLWVDNGCRADFAFGGGGGYRPPPPPPPPQIITCSSNNGKRN